MIVVSGAGGSWAGIGAGGGVVFCGGGAEDWGDIDGDRYASGIGLRLWLIRPTGLERFTLDCSHTVTLPSCRT